VQRETTAAALTKEFGATLRPIPINASLLTYLDQSKRLEFLKTWQQNTVRK
jgi:iron(III) transport system substrate-binding protein